MSEQPNNSKIYNALTKIQTISAFTFSGFVLMHGAQILGANVGGSRYANYAIMNFRPIYQDAHLEGILVTGSAMTHVLAGLAKAAMRPSRKINRHRLAGYALIPTVGLHYYLVRSIPIKYYGDSAFIDFGYIAWGLQNRPWFTYGLHVALALATGYHVVYGAQYLVKRRSSSNNSKKIKNALAAGLGLALVSGLVIIGRDTKKIPLRIDFQKMYSMVF
ncbi:hypothetical protein K501DRAFT_288502 [Backusella circina FSU 941]|nr:hypothetical protein K501DRAFT_288502 [Backusella circina FSU 941]